MSVISNEEIDRIRASVNIVDVISSYLPLTQRGKNYFGVCPFHDDHSPSMSVSTDKQIYKCFSCGATGNVYTFLMDYEHINFMEALKICADLAGIPINIETNTNFSNKNLEPLYNIYDTAIKFYQNNINTTNGKEAKEYLLSRDMNEEIIKEFGIGLALKDRSFLTKLLTSKNYSQTDLIRSGLVIKSEYGISDIYSNRIMFPLWDLAGKVVGFSGRVYHGEKESKYINTMGTEIFHKGELIYNYHKAKEYARLNGTIIIMEGFVDVIRAYTIGVKNVVATMGTAVTKEQATLIKRMAKNVILCFDGDAAGAKATLACSDILISLGITPKIVRLEENLDPDEYIRKYGKDRFLEKLENPINVMDFKLSYLKKDKDLTSSVDMASYVNNIIKELSLIDDEVLREISLKKISEEANLDIEFLKVRLQNLDNAKKIEVKEIKKTNPIQYKNKYEIAERNLLFYMVNFPDAIKIYLENMPYISTERFRFLSREIVNFYKEHLNMALADFISYLKDDPDNLNTLNEIIKINLKEEYDEKEIKDYIKAIKDFNIETEIKRLQLEMKKTDSVLEKTKIAEQIVDLKKRREENG